MFQNSTVNINVLCKSCEDMACCSSECVLTWCGMIDGMLVGPVILDDRITGQNYLDFLQDELPKQLEDVPLATRIAMYYQHDGSPSHYTWHVRQNLNDTFPNRRIGRGSTINWPPRSPDLTPLDFCLWGWKKSEVYRKKVDTRDELLINILDVTTCIKEHQDKQHAMSSHELQSALMLTVEFSNIYYKLYQLCHLNNKYRH